MLAVWVSQPAELLQQLKTTLNRPKPALHGAQLGPPNGLPSRLATALSLWAKQQAKQLRRLRNMLKQPKQT